MDFTEIYKHSYGLVQFSPGTHFILTAVEDRLIVRRSDTFHVARSWTVDNAPSRSTALTSATGPQHPKMKEKASMADGWVSHAGWSSDSEYIFAACTKRGIINVYKLQDEEWGARIEAGVEGLAKVEWAPDGRTLVCFSDWGVRPIQLEQSIGRLTGCKDSCESLCGRS